MAPKRTVNAKCPIAKRVKVVEDPFVDACEAALALLVESNLNETTRNMLQASAAFALRPPRSIRHAHQSGLADNLHDLLQQVATGKRKSVEEWKGKVTDIDTERDATNRAFELVATKEKERRQGKEDCDAALKAAKARVVSNKIKLADYECVMKELQGEHERHVAEKVEREKLTNEAWNQLKEGSMGGKQWRVQNKLIESIKQVLEERDVDASCVSALPFALKEKPEHRGPFSLKCINYAETVLQTSLQELLEKIEGHAGNVGEKKAAVKKLNADVRHAEGERGARETGCVAAENALFEASEERKSIQGVLKKVDARAKEVLAVFTEVEEEFGQMTSVITRFETVLEGGQVALLAQEMRKETILVVEKEKQDVVAADTHSDIIELIDE